MKWQSGWLCEQPIENSTLRRLYLWKRTCIAASKVLTTTQPPTSVGWDKQRHPWSLTMQRVPTATYCTVHANFLIRRQIKGDYMLMFKDSKEIWQHQILMVEKADSYYGQGWSIVWYLLPCTPKTVAFRCLICLSYFLRGQICRSCCHSPLAGKKVSGPSKSCIIICPHVSIMTVM